MILRRIATAFRKQDWFTVAVETMIVVLGVFLGLQAQGWSVERERQSNERDYLARLHGEVVLLIEGRASYDESRKNFSEGLLGALAVLKAPAGAEAISVEQCDAIAGSAHTTVPPAELPTIMELLTTGRLDQLTSAPVRTAILNYTQEAARARDLILVITESGRDLGKQYPHLITHNVGPARVGLPDSVWLNPECNTHAMRANPVFLNELGENAYMYNVYAERAVFPVSAQLATLHAVLDDEIGASHASEGQQTP
tara:strand:- start:444 stop:1208 length:765 start_codon:yes stop_codon:yes gene_type:complete